MHEGLDQQTKGKGYFFFKKKKKKKKKEWPERFGFHKLTMPLPLEKTREYSLRKECSEPAFLWLHPGTSGSVGPPSVEEHHEQRIDVSKPSQIRRHDEMPFAKLVPVGQHQHLSPQASPPAERA